MMTAVRRPLQAADAEQRPDAAGLYLAEREAAWRDLGLGQHGIVDAQGTGPLPMDVVEEAERRVAPPERGSGSVLEPLLDLSRVQPRVSLQQQGDRAGHVRRRHRRAAQHAEPTPLQRKRRANRAARRGDVWFEAQ